MYKEVWIMINPDNDSYDVNYAYEIIEVLSKRLGIDIYSRNITRDQGNGTEEKFVLVGEKEDIELFEQFIKDELY